MSSTEITPVNMSLSEYIKDSNTSNWADCSLNNQTETNSQNSIDTKPSLPENLQNLSIMERNTPHDNLVPEERNITVSVYNDLFSKERSVWRNVNDNIDVLNLRENQYVNHSRDKKKNVSKSVNSYLEKNKNKNRKKYVNKADEHYYEIHNESQTNNNIKMIDFFIDEEKYGENKELNLYHYIECNQDSDDNTKAQRGIIKSGNKIVCKTFGYTEEISSNNPSLLQQLHSFNQCKFYDAEEGATIRLFYHNDKWFISTHRKINAFQSKWGDLYCSSFGDRFITGLLFLYNNDPNFKLEVDSKNNLVNQPVYSCNIFKYYTELLDKSKNYTFLVRNYSQNRIVCDAPENQIVYFIGAFDKNTNLLLEGNDSFINFPPKLSFENQEELISYVNNLDYRYKQGVIVYFPNQTQLKIMNPTYLEYFEARGNEPSIKFRYLQVRLDNKKVNMLYKLYPEYINTFRKYEGIIYKLTKHIYQSYVKRYIKKELVSLPQQQYFVMQACHSWYMCDKLNNRISIDKVNEVMNNQSATSLNRLIKSFKM